MRFLFILFFFCLMAEGLSQDIQYLDEHGYVLKRRGKKNAYSFQEITKNETHYIVKRFTMGERLLSVIHYKDATFHIKDGKHARWDDQGNKVVEGNFMNGEKEGLWVSFWPNTEKVRRTINYHQGKKDGQLMEMDTAGIVRLISFYKKDRQHGKYITKSADEKILVATNYKEGQLNGFFKSFYDNGKPVRKDYYTNGELIKKRCFTREGKDTSYFPHIIHPVFPGCNEHHKNAKSNADCSDRKLLEFLYKNIHYPEKAREFEIEGTAVIGFTVDKEGNITNIEPVVSLSGDIEAECLRLINMLPKFRPGIVDGKIADVHYYLPLKFRLE